MTLAAPRSRLIAPAPVPVAPPCALKLVYWGCGLSGKTTNLKWLHARLRPELRGRLITLDSPGERTIYFDCLPLDLEARGRAVSLRLYTVPGQPRFRLTRRLVLLGVDALVLVWDARTRRLQENLRSLLEARESLEELGRSWDDLPRVIQINKQDLSPLTPRAEIDRALDAMKETGPRIESVAIEGKGVLETLSAAARAALARKLTVAGDGAA